MTYSTLATTGRGTLLLWLRIAGIPTVFGDSTRTPAAGDTWFHSEGHTVVKPWLKIKFAHDERGSFVDGTMEVAGASVEICDPSGEMTALVESWLGRTMTRLTSTLAAGHVASAVVESSTDFAASGDIYCGQETIGYDSKADATHFTTLARGKYGSHDVDHVVDATSPLGPIQPSVLDGPALLDGRRANIYAATLDADGTVSAGECIFRGYIASVGSPGEGVWPLKIDHVWKMLSRKVAADLPRATLVRGYWFSGEAATSTITVYEIDETSTPATVLPVEVTIPEGFYAGHEELRAALSTAAYAAQLAAGVTRFLWVTPAVDDEGAETTAIGCNSTGDTDFSVALSVREGDPLWCLGFEATDYSIPVGSGDEVIKAQDAPKLFYCEIPGFASSVAPELEVEESGDLVAGEYVQLGPDSPAVKIDSVSGTTVTLDPSSWDIDHVFTEGRQLRWYVIEEDAAALVMRHVWGLVGTDGAGISLRVALQRLLNLAGTHPQSWGLAGWGSDDLVTGDLDAALEGLPAPLTSMRHYITEPVTAAGVICDRLGLLGITPRIVASGAVGFSRLETPARLNAYAVEVDEHIAEAYDAGRVRTQMNAEPRINEIAIQHSWDYVRRTWPEKPSYLGFDDGRATLGAVRTRTYVCPGLHLATVGRPCYDSESALLNDVKVRAIGAHFGIYGRMAPTLRVPCVWLSRQFYVGDVVLVTHPCAVDVPSGVIGMVERLGVIVGRHHVVSGRPDEADYLDIMVPPELNVGGIAPAAHGTTWTGADKRLDFAAVDLYAQTGDTDLTYFASGDKVRLYTYGTTTPSVWTGEIAAVAADHVHLTADPFGGLFPAAGVVMTPGAYDDCDDEDKARWLYFADHGYELGAGGDPGKRWAL